jgi:hypothetical protein
VGIITKIQINIIMEDKEENKQGKHTVKILYDPSLGYNSSPEEFFMLFNDDPEYNMSWQELIDLGYKPQTNQDTIPKP